MNLFTHPKKKQSSQIGQPASKADSLLPPEPLAALRQLIAPMRERMMRYDEAIQALAVARDRLLDLEDLPPPDTPRWTAYRKALVVRAVDTGLLTRAQAFARYSLSAEEFDGWSRRAAEFGEPGLRATKLNQYRLAG